MLSEGLVNLLLTTDPVKSLLAARKPAKPNEPAGAGIRPSTMPEGYPLPAIVYREIHGDGLMTMDGPDALQFSRMEFGCYGKTYAESKILARGVRQILEAFTGALSDGTVIGTMQRVGEVDAFEDAPFVYMTPVDVAITYLDVGSNS
jgi:hypothetical protein